MKTTVEAVIALCKCLEGKHTYAVRFEKQHNNSWSYNWAFTIKEKTARHEGYDATIVSGNIKPSEEYPGCPYCKTNSFIVCDCGKLTCNNGNYKRFKCPWCGQEGEIVLVDSVTIKSGRDI